MVPGEILWWVSLPFIAFATVKIDKTTYISCKPFVTGAADHAKHIIFNALPNHCDTTLSTPRARDKNNNTANRTLRQLNTTLNEWQ